MTTKATDANEIEPTEIETGDTVTIRYKTTPSRLQSPKIRESETTVISVEGTIIHMEHVFDEMDGKVLLDTSANELWHREDGHPDTFMGNFAFITSIE